MRQLVKKKEEKKDLKQSTIRSQIKKELKETPFKTKDKSKKKKATKENAIECNTLCITPMNDVDGFEEVKSSMKQRPKSESYVQNLILVEEKIDGHLIDLPKVTERKRSQTYVRSSISKNQFKNTKCNIMKDMN